MVEIDAQKLLNAQRAAWYAYANAEQALIYAEAFGAHASVTDSIQKSAEYAWAALSGIVRN